MCDCGGNDPFARFGARVGAQLGTKVWNKGEALAKRFKSWTGLGDYKLVSNSLIAGSSAGGEPQFSTGGRGIRIRYKEYLGDIITHPTTVGAFHVTKFVVNPGNMTTFPWASVLANQFDQYKPEGVIFEYLSTVGESNTSSGALGSVIMMTDYDINDPTPTSKQYMLNTAYSQEAKMSENAVHGLECDPDELQRSVFYTRNQIQQSGTSRDFDLGNFFIATQGGDLAAGTTVGSLYIHYEMEFFKEQPHGGLLQRNMLQAGYVKLYDAGASPLTWRSPEHQMGSDFVDMSLDGKVTFPRVGLAGAVVCIELFFISSGAFTVPAAAPLFTFTECTALPSGPLGGLPGFGSYPNDITAPQGGVAAVSRTYQQLIVKLNDQPSTDPSVEWDNTGPMRTVTLAGDTLAFRFTVFPDSYPAITNA